MPRERIFVRPRHYSWWVSAGLLIIAAAMFTNFLITNPRWQWDVVGEYLFHPDVMRGLTRTIYLTLISGFTGLVMAGVVAYLRLSKNPVFRMVAALFIWLIRAIPALVLLLFVFFLAALLPQISLGIPFGPEFVSWSTNSLISQFTAAVLGLTLIQGAYGGEIYRAGILSVPKGQTEAALALGMTRATAMRRIVAPQAVRVIIPPLSNELITLFKSTSLVSIIGFAELLTTVQLIYGRNYQTIPLLLVACLWYLLLTSIAMVLQGRLEARFGRGFNARSRRGRKTLNEIRTEVRA